MYSVFLYCLCIVLYIVSPCVLSLPCFCTSLPTTATGWNPIVINKCHIMSYISWQAFWIVHVVSVHAWNEQRCQLCLWSKCTATVQISVVRAVIGRCYVTWPWPSTVTKSHEEVSVQECVKGQGNPAIRWECTLFKMVFYLQTFTIQFLGRGDDIPQTIGLSQFLHYIIPALFLQIITITNKDTENN